MVVKETFELITGKSGNVHNIAPINADQLKNMKIQDFERSYLNTLCTMYSKTKVDSISQFAGKKIDEVLFIRNPEYPLPGFVTKDMVPVVNLSYIPGIGITDYSAADIFSMIVYSTTLKSFIQHKPFKDEIWEHVSAFIFLVFMRIPAFGKKSGLMGSYKDLIPKLRLLINIYIFEAMLGKKVDDMMIKKFESMLYTDCSDMNLDFNFSSIIEFLRAINKNRIIPISENLFAQTIIKLTGVSSIPMFEDLSRFFATLLASTVAGNTVFSTYWKKIKIDLFNKLVIFGMNHLK